MEASLLFQSLFYWNDLMVNTRHLWQAPIHREFQSLFYWNDLMVRGPSGIEGWSMWSFNPCSIGMTLWWSSIADCCFAILCFNPCSIGMTLWWAPFWPALPKHLSFNPCSIGMTLWCCKRRACWRSLNTFQSLFYWNDLMVNKCQGSGSSASSSFNPCSIGMTLWWAAHRTWRYALQWFQSLFYWNDLMVSNRGLPARVRDHVSILVLLEWPYGVFFSLGQSQTSLIVSILVLLEWPYGVGSAV